MYRDSNVNCLTQRALARQRILDALDEVVAMNSVHPQ